MTQYAETAAVGEWAASYIWRVGRKVGRTIYAQITHEPLDTDPLIGVMDHPFLARAAVVAHNLALGYDADGHLKWSDTDQFDGTTDA